MNMNEYFNELELEIEIYENPLNFRNIKLFLPKNSQSEKNVCETQIRIVAYFQGNSYTKFFKSIQEAKLFKVKFIADIKSEMAEIVMQGVFLGLDLDKQWNK